MNTDSQFVKRLKSLAWRSGMMGLAAFVAYAAANLDVLQLTVGQTAFLGLVLGEVSKYINSQSA